METDTGTFTIDLDTKNAPKTVNNFVFLARYHYYDGIPFHRVIPGFVVQGGDPPANGVGGPGYKFADELPKAGALQGRLGGHGQLRARTPTAASSSSSPATPGVNLPPQYSLFGKVTEGMDVVQGHRGRRLPGVDAGKPSDVIKILTVTIKET